MIEFRLYPKQKQALLSKANEILYGGAAGGGKSYFLRVIAILLALEIPNLKIFLFRRLYRELYISHVYNVDGFQVLLKDLLDAGDVVFNKSDGVYTFYNGSQIYLCHAQHESDIQGYLSAEIHLLLIDEATQFTEKMIRFIRTRVRLGTLPIPDKWKNLLPKIIYASNPGGISHKYFKRGFVAFGAGKLFTAPETDGGMLREFVPATHTDNILMMRNDPRYGSRILGLGDAKQARAYLEGVWDLEEGTAFGDLWDPDKHVVSDIIVPPTWKIDRSHDYGYSAPGGTLYFAESDGTRAIINDLPVILPRKSLVIINELYFADKEGKGLRLTPIELGTRMREFEVMRKLRHRVQPGPADASIFDKQVGYSSIHDYYVQCGVRFYRGDKRSGSRERGFVITRQMLLAAKIRDPEHPWLLVCRTCPNIISQIPELPTDPENPQDVDSEADDHLYDAIRYRVLKNLLRAETTPFEGY